MLLPLKLSFFHVDLTSRAINKQLKTHVVVKIGILTQPLHTNYGGVIQAFAMQHVLKNLGHDPYTIDLPFRRSYYSLFKGLIYRLKQRIIYNEVIPSPVPTKNDYQIITQNIQKFIYNNIQLTEKIPYVENLGNLDKYHFDAYLVGSDQVWRPKYSPGIPAFFLDFITDKKIKKISYAASFGTSEWEFSDSLTEKCRILIHNFDAVSVREDSAVDLCKVKFGINAEQHLDPSLLLDRKVYENLVNEENILPKENILTVYVLDRDPLKNRIIEEVSRTLSLSIHSLMPPKKFQDGFDSLEECIFPPVTEWIKGFIDAQFVITDSFHGTIFSILFNKPFISIANNNRGITRFTSILKKFNLEHRLIYTDSEIHDLTSIIHTNMDFDYVNEIIEVEKSRAINFLKNHLL